MELVICRHTQTDDNAQRIYSGQRDTPLNAFGRQQSDELAAVVAGLQPILRKPGGHPYAAVVASDLVRAVYLGEKIAALAGASLIVTEGLREVNIGDMTGMVREEALAEYKKERHKTSTAEFDYGDIRGESAQQVIHRQIKVLEMLYHRFGASARIALVGHGTSLRLLFLHHLGLITSLHEQGDYQQVSWR